MLTEERTDYLDQWATGYGEAIGINFDSVDSPYLYLMGLTNAESRMDFMMKCKSGGVPCGGRCLPPGQKCGGKEKQLAQRRQSAARLRTKGAALTGASVGGAVAGPPGAIAGAAVGAGVSAARNYKLQREINKAGGEEAYRKKKQQEAKAAKAEAIQAKKEAKAEARQTKREERQEVKQTRKAEKQENRQSRREERQEVKTAKVEARQTKREERRNRGR